MRSIRRAAVAGAAALALTVSGMSVASAAEEAPQQGPSLSSQVGENMEKDKPFDFNGFVTSSEDDSAKIDNAPVWAKVLFAGTVLGAIGSFIGLIVGPIANFINHG
ncbi:hypothetical protein CFRA_07350 [Corynebacterium frankenforstense DSM 45800]|uniref:Or membrane protein n=1 Tax=Corynebacterium frankenforstense DSM 45800 TaxID=1437875 RepID=A0A1L7CTC0_9CORY|nr:hypothetical protein [Corynebacterium frankenforstense]APT89102.1 hypothetical protein CFRA_07350 [Corynebacterium frankenforstense DSM 45800]